MPNLPGSLFLLCEALQCCGELDSKGGFAIEVPGRIGQAEMAKGGGLFFRAWPSLGAAPPWPAGLSPAPGTARPLLGVKGSVGTTLAWLLSPALMLICPCFGLLCFKKHGSISPAGRPPRD